MVDAALNRYLEFYKNLKNFEFFYLLFEKTVPWLYHRKLRKELIWKK